MTMHTLPHSWRQRSGAVLLIGGLSLVVGGVGLATLGTAVASGPAYAWNEETTTTVAPTSTTAAPTTTMRTTAAPTTAAPTTAALGPVVQPEVLQEVAPTTAAPAPVLGEQLAFTGQNTDPLTWIGLTLIALGVLVVTFTGRRHGAAIRR